MTTDENQGVMDRAPRPRNSPLLDGPSLRFVIAVGLLGGIAALGLLAGLPQWGYSFGETQTLVFCYLVWVQILFVLPARRVNIQSGFNPWVSGSLLLVAVLQLAVVLVPEFRILLHLEALPVNLWMLLILILFFSWLGAESVARQLRKVG